jgi:hypothetical protein
MSFFDIAPCFLDLLGVLLRMRTSVGFCNGRWSHSARERLLHDEAAHAANPARGSRDKNGVRHRSASRLHIVSTTRKRALPLIMRSYASAARSRGYTSFIERTPDWTLNASVSSESMDVPV